MAYYDQLGQFDNTGLSDISDFVTVKSPLHWRGGGLRQSLLYLSTSRLRSSYVLSLDALQVHVYGPNMEGTFTNCNHSNNAHPGHGSGEGR